MTVHRQSLTAAQRRMLLEAFASDDGAVTITDRRLRPARALAERGLVEVGFYNWRFRERTISLTEAGRRLARSMW